VARLAGLTNSVIDEANNFLKKFEQTHDFNQMSL
jgi:DNA mismatch repair ATPase MutS